MRNKWCWEWMWLVLLGALSTMSIASAAEDLSAQFPADTMLYIAVDDLSATSKAIETTPLGKILNEEDVKTFVAHVRTSLEQLLQEQESIPAAWVKDVLAAMSHGMALGLSTPQFPHPPQMRILINLPDVETGTRLLKSLPEMVKKTGETLPPEVSLNPEGVSTIKGPDGVLSFEIQGKRLVFWLNKTGETLPAVTKSLADSDAFKAVRKELGSRQDVMVYFDMAPLWQQASAMAKSKGDKQGLAVMEAMGVTGLQQMGVSLAAEPQGFVTRAFLHLPDGRKGFFGMMDETPLSDAILKTIPASATQVMLKRAKMSTLMSVIREAGMAGGAKKEEIDQTMSMVSMQFGVHPEHDFLNQLGDEMAFFVVPSDKLGGIPLFGLNGMAIVMEVKDGKAIEKTLSKVFQMASLFSMASEYRVQNKTLPMGKRTAQILKVPFNLLAPGFVLTEKYLVLGMGPQVLQHTLDTIDGKRKSIINEKEFQEALQRVNGKGGQILAYSARPTFSTSGPMAGFSSLGVMAGMLMPALSNARDKANSVMSINHLKHIGVGIMQYQADYEKPPEKLSDLVEKDYIPTPETFINPQTGEGYHYLSGWGRKLPPNSIIAWEASGPRRNVLFHDGHVENMDEDKFLAAYDKMVTWTNGNNMAVKVLDPWVPEGADGAVASSGASTAVPEFDVAFLRKLGESIPLYMLPAAESINKHLFASSACGRVMKNGFVFTSVSAIPFSELFELNTFSGLTTLPLILGTTVFHMEKAGMPMDSGPDIPDEMQNFPHTYMTEKTHKLIIKRGVGTQVPFVDEASGEKAWECYQCLNPECPGKHADGTPYRFPHIMKEMEMPKGEELPPEMKGMPMFDMTPPMCPKCKKAKQDDFNVDRYITEEGKELQKKINAYYKKKYGDN